MGQLAPPIAVGPPTPDGSPDRAAGPGPRLASWHGRPFFAGEVDCFPSARANPCRNVGDCIPSSIHQNEPAALSGEQLGDRRPNARSGACDEARLASDGRRHGRPPPARSSTKRQPGTPCPDGIQTHSTTGDHEPTAAIGCHPVQARWAEAPTARDRPRTRSAPAVATAGCQNHQRDADSNEGRIRPGTRRS